MATSLELAITAVRSGRKEEGRQLLNLLIQQNPNDEMAWLWMSSVVNTDEQRARCLYHVLAINPDNEIARKGLKILGIVVSDSRPVKVPRDSQPINIPNPTPKSQAEGPWLDKVEERRPFRIDPKAIVDELPFIPVKQPFSEALQTDTASPESEAAARSPSPARPELVGEANATATQAPQPQAQPGWQGEQAARPSEPVPVVQAGAPGGGMTPQAQPPGTRPLQAGLGQQQAQPDTGPLQNSAGRQPSPQPAPPDTGPMHPATQLYYAPASQPYNPETMPLRDTRPSQPVPVTYSTMGMGMSQPAQPTGQDNQGQYPLQPGSAIHANTTMGMPMPYPQAQGYSQPVPAVHSNTTMGMPFPAQPPGYGNPQMPHPSEPVPVVQAHNPPGMAAYGQPQYQQSWPQYPGVHSSSTMAMPADYDPMAALRASAGQSDMVDYRVANAYRPSTGPKPNKKGGDEEEEVNILAVIIFGSLSVTALGGLGMLILLMFTSG